MTALHAREQITNKVAELIGASVVAMPPNGKLQTKPLHNSARTETPIALVAWRSEDVVYARIMGKPLRQERQLAVVVALRDKVLDDQTPDPVEAMAVQVEALLQHERLNNLVSAWRLTGSEREIDTSGENTVVMITMSFAATYFTNANDPTVIIQ